MYNKYQEHRRERHRQNQANVQQGGFSFYKKASMPSPYSVGAVTCPYEVKDGKIYEKSTGKTMYRIPTEKSGMCASEIAAFNSYSGKTSSDTSPSKISLFAGFASKFASDLTKSTPSSFSSGTGSTKWYDRDPICKEYTQRTDAQGRQFWQNQNTRATYWDLPDDVRVKYNAKCGANVPAKAAKYTAPAKTMPTAPKKPLPTPPPPSYSNFAKPGAYTQTPFTQPPPAYNNFVPNPADKLKEQCESRADHKWINNECVNKGSFLDLDEMEKECKSRPKHEWINHQCISVNSKRSNAAQMGSCTQLFNTYGITNKSSLNKARLQYKLDSAKSAEINNCADIIQFGGSTRKYRAGSIVVGGKRRQLYKTHPKSRSKFYITASGYRKYI